MDLRAGADSVEASIFHAWLARVVDFALTDELEALSDTKGVSPVLAPAQRMTAVLALLDRPEHALWDDLRTPGTIETRDDIFTHALTAAIADLTRATGSPELSRWQWGPLHTVRFKSVIPHFSLSLGADLSIPAAGERSFPAAFRAAAVSTPSIKAGRCCRTRRGGRGRCSTTPRGRPGVLSVELTARRADRVRRAARRRVGRSLVAALSRRGRAVAHEPHAPAVADA